MSTFHNYTNGSRRLTIRVEHHMSTFDLAAAWVSRHYRHSSRDCPDPTSQRDVLRVAREAMKENPNSVYYASDGVPIAEIERLDKVVAVLFDEAPDHPHCVMCERGMPESALTHDGICRNCEEAP